MTQQYLNGELSVCLGEVCDEPGNSAVPEVADLRRRVEEAPPGALPALALEAVEVLDAVCWASLAAGDTGAFERGCRRGAQLYELATCAGLLA